MSIFDRWKRNRLPERGFYKLEGDTIEAVDSFGRHMDYRPGNIFGVATGVSPMSSGGYDIYANAGPSLNADAWSFGYPGDYTDYNGLN
jgi:hypothetical protein